MSKLSNSENRLVVGKPNIMDRDGFLKDVEEILDTRIFTNLGPFATKLEAEVCSYLKVKHAFAVSNATVGLAMTLRALELEPGGEVIVPAYTFIASAHAVIEAGLTPVFCDCDAISHLITPKEVSVCITERTVAILAVNLWGLPCDVEGLEALAEMNGVALVYDSAHSFGAVAPCGRFLGNFGSAEVFSLHATKLFNSFEGGLITTNDGKLAERLSLIRNFGIGGQDVVAAWGSNYKLSEIHSAFALRQLGRMELLKTTYKDNALCYTELLDESAIPGLRNWNKDFLSHVGCTHSYICLEVQDEYPLSRDEVISRLREHNIFAKRYFFPGLHKCQPYVKLDRNHDSNLPVTERLCNQVIILPTGTNVNREHVASIVHLLREFSFETQARKHRESPDKEVSVDWSHITERMEYVRQMKSKYEKLAESCEKDLLFLEASLPKDVKRNPGK